MPTIGVLNYIPIDARVATAGQPNKGQFEALATAGLQAVINLAPQDPDWTGFDEAELLGAMGLDYSNIPVPWDDPRESHLTRFFAAMDALADRKLLVHCVMNLRATAFVALDAIKRRNWTTAEADRFLAPLWSDRAEYAENGIWRRFIDAQRARLSV